MVVGAGLRWPPCRVEPGQNVYSSASFGVYLDGVGLIGVWATSHRGPRRAAFISSIIRMFAMARDRCDLLCLDLEVAEGLRQNRLPAPLATDRARLAAALGDPTRLIIAVALRAGSELCVCDLSWIAEKPENLVSHHLRALREAGIAESRREGKMVMYSLTESGASLLALLIDGVAEAAA